MSERSNYNWKQAAQDGIGFPIIGAVAHALNVEAIKNGIDAPLLNLQMQMIAATIGFGAVRIAIFELEIFVNNIKKNGIKR